MKKLIKDLLPLVGMLGIAGVAHAQDATPVPGGTVIIAVNAEPLTLNPATTTASGETLIGCMIHEGLIEIAGDGTYVPDLAESWTISDDQMTYTFQLREANWHDGKPFTAEDVAYFFSDVMQYAPLITAQLGDKIENVEVLGEHEISITLNQPFGPFMRMLACYNGGAMIPKHVYEGLNPSSDPASLAPIGTGPFKFVSWRTGEAVELVKNEDYWRGDIPLDAAVIRIMPNGGSRTQAMLAGEVDYMQSYHVPLNDYDTIEASEDLELIQSGLAPNNLIGFFNIRKEPFNNKEVRQALYSVIDREFIWEAAFHSRGLPGTVPFPKQLKWSAAEEIDYGTMYPADFDKANAMLDEAGFEADANGNRFNVSIIYEANNSERMQTATIIQSAWAKLGVTVELTPLENAVSLSRVYLDHDFDVFLVSYSTYGDPALGLARIWISGSLDTTWGNASGYSNPEVDEMFVKAGSLSDIQERAAIYRDIQKILADDLPVMSFQENVRLDATTKKLKGLWGYEGMGQWYQAWLEQ